MSVRFLSIAFAWITIQLLAPEAARAYASLHATAWAPNNFAGSAQVQLDQHCYVGAVPEGGTACQGSSLGLSTDLQTFQGSTGFAAFEPNLATGQIKAFVSANSGEAAGGGGLGDFQDAITMHLAPGASWPQTFTIRAVLQGNFETSPDTPVWQGTGSYYSLNLAGNQVSTAFIGDAFSATTHEYSVTIDHEQPFTVEARLALYAWNTRPGSIDYSTELNHGLRVELELPPGLTMTSESGVFLTEQPQAGGIILPPPTPPPGCRAGSFCFPTGGVAVPGARSFDPPVVRAYEYEASGGAFATLSLPTGVGDDIFDLYVFDATLQDFVFVRSLPGGVKHWFEGFVDRFQVRGIEASAGLDPTDATAFVTDLSFMSAGPVDLTMTPILAECINAIDDDADGYTDFAGGDPGCTDEDDLSERGTGIVCDDGTDNDGDGKADFIAAGGGDPGCRGPASGRENPQCNDGLNNDNATGIDFDGGASLDLDHSGFIDPAFNLAMPAVADADPDCMVAWRNTEATAATRHCGLGFEVTLALLPLAWARRRRERSRDLIRS